MALELKSSIKADLGRDVSLVQGSTTLELKSSIKTDFYGELQETNQPFEVVREAPAPLPITRLRPPRVAR